MAKEKNDAELREIPETPTKLKVRRWVKQANVEIGLHPSVAATLESIRTENGELQKRLEQNNITYAKIISGQLKYYKVAYNPNLGNIEWSENNTVISIPQPDKMKEE